MKEIRMDYSEYEEMVKTIQTQQDAIEEFKKASNVVLVDNRHSTVPDIRWFSGRIPVVVSDGELAKSMMKDEFDRLFAEAKNIEVKAFRQQVPDPAPIFNTRKWWHL